MGTHPIFESDFDCLTDMGDQFLRDLVGNAATCVTIIMFLCPMPTIGQINRQKAVPHGFNVYPYAFTAVLATLWINYRIFILFDIILAIRTESTDSSATIMSSCLL